MDHNASSAFNHTGSNSRGNRGMGRQTQMSHKVESVNSRIDRSAFSDARNGLAGLLDDLIALTELQCRLLRLDFAECSRAAAVPLLVLAMALVLLLSAIPVLMMAVAWALIEGAAWSPPWAFAAVGCLSGAGAAGPGWFWVKRLRLAGQTMDRSVNEFSGNIHWLRNALRRQRATAD